MNFIIYIGKLYLPGVFVTNTDIESLRSGYGGPQRVYEEKNQIFIFFKATL
jgi:hypothetical protein